MKFISFAMLLLLSASTLSYARQVSDPSSEDASGRRAAAAMADPTAPTRAVVNAETSINLATQQVMVTLATEKGQFSQLKTIAQNPSDAYPFEVKKAAVDGLFKGSQWESIKEIVLNTATDADTRAYAANVLANGDGYRWRSEISAILRRVGDMRIVDAIVTSPNFATHADDMIAIFDGSSSNSLVPHPTVIAAIKGAVFNAYEKDATIFARQLKALKLIAAEAPDLMSGRAAFVAASTIPSSAQTTVTAATSDAIILGTGASYTLVQDPNRFAELVKKSRFF